MTEVVVALLMFLNGNMIEFTYKESMSKCLKSKRIAMREINPDTVLMSCKKITAENKAIMVYELILFKKPKLICFTEISPTKLRM